MSDLFSKSSTSFVMLNLYTRPKHVAHTRPRGPPLKDFINMSTTSGEEFAAGFVWALAHPHHFEDNVTHYYCAGMGVKG